MLSTKQGFIFGAFVELEEIKSLLSFPNPINFQTSKNMIWLITSALWINDSLLKQKWFSSNIWLLTDAEQQTYFSVHTGSVCYCLMPLVTVFFHGLNIFHLHLSGRGMSEHYGMIPQKLWSDDCLMHLLLRCELALKMLWATVPFTQNSVVL